MKTNRNRQKYPIGEQLPMLFQKGLKTAGMQLFMRLQKKLQIDNKQKINLNLAENAFETVKPNYGQQNMFNCTFYKNQ